MTVEMILRAKGPEVATIAPEATASVALHQLATKGIGALVVTADGQHIEGVVSERDIVRGIAQHGERLLAMQVTEVMSRNAPVCAPTDGVKYVMSEMTRTRHRHLPVVNNGRLAGIVSIGDVVKRRLEELEMETVAVREAYITHRLPYAVELRD